MKNYMLVIGVFFCFGASYAQEKTTTTHTTPTEVSSIPRLEAQRIKIAEAEAMGAQSSRSGAVAAQQKIQQLREEYAHMLADELSKATTDQTRNALQLEWNHVRQLQEKNVSQH